MQRQVQCQLALSRAGIQRQRQTVAACASVAAHGHRAGANLRAPVGDMGAAAQGQHALLSRHGRLRDQPVDPQRGDVDIQIGQQRPLVRPAWRQLRDAVQDHFPRADAANVDMAAQIGQGPPIKREARCGEHRSPAIAQRQIVQGQRAIERSLDPPHRDAQPACKGLAGQLPRDQPVAGCGIQRRDQERQQQSRTQQRKRGDPQRTPARTPGLGGVRCGWSRTVHQNACPIET